MTRADQAVLFINNLTLCDAYLGKPMKLRPWQEDIIRRLNEVREDGLLKKRRCLFLIPRKQAKTSLAACIATHHILGTEKTGLSALCAASDRDQATHLFSKVQTIIEADPYLDRQCKIYRSKKIIETKSGNKLQVLSSEGRRAYGTNPSLVIIDEYFTQKNRELYDALTSGFAARQEYLTLLISTQGNRRDSPLFQEYEYACKVRDGLVTDDEYLPIIYEATEQDDWREESTWFKAMPALGDFAELDFIRSEFKKALEIPSDEAKFKQFYLNMLVSEHGKWLNRAKWDACGTYPVDPEALKGRRCYLGADLSAKSDVTAIVLVFPMDTTPQSYQVMPFFWVPKEYAQERDRKGYSTWQKHAEKGLVTLTTGFYIDDDQIVDKVIELSKLYNIKRAIFDEWSANRPCSLLNAAGIKAEKMAGVNSKMNEPLKYLETMIATEKLHHGNNPILNVMADNCTINQDSNGNIRLDKRNSHEKIDGMSALCLGIAAAMVETRKKVSVYESRGLASLADLPDDH